MTPEDTITIVMLSVGLLLVLVMYILFKHKKLKVMALPRVLGVGAGVYVFVSFTVASIILRPLSELVHDTFANLLSALVFGIAGYISGRTLARRYQDKN